MNEIQWVIEAPKLIASVLTPLIVLILGLVISKKLEKAKLAVLKEKEWQVKWADMFLTLAIEFNNTASFMITSFHYLPTYQDAKKIEEINTELKVKLFRLSEINWNIKNYTQFSHESGYKVIAAQENLLSLFGETFSGKHEKMDSEQFGKLQIEYNSAVRDVHRELLNSSHTKQTS